MFLHVTIYLLLSQVLQSYAHGLAALKLTAKDTGLTIDNVDETMAELAEVLININANNIHLKTY